MRRSHHLFALATSLLTVSLAHADGPYLVGDLELEEPPTSMTVETDDGWRFEPGTIDGELVGLLAVYEGDGGTEASIRLAWFEPAGEGRWSGFGWQDAEEVSAAAFLADLFQAPALFERSGLAPLDLAAVPLAPDPLTLRLGFDEGDPFQPLLEVADAPVAEALVEAGGAGMPELAPLALPVEVGGVACGSALEAGLNDMEIDYRLAFGGDQELPADESPAADGCGSLWDWCWPSTHTFKSHTTCSPWSGWHPAVGGWCERTRTCTDHFTKVRVKIDCSSTTSTFTGSPYTDRQRKTAGPHGC